MATITTRSGKGSPLTNNEVDANFTNLNTDKAELSGAAFTGAITTNSTFDGRDVATDGTKLDGIEASADVTDTANVTAAGALMDSELTSIASVKALNQGVATTDSPTFVDVTATSLDISGNIDVDGTTNLDVVDIDGAVDMASTLQVDGAATFTTEITANGGIALGDSDKATFGTGDDLEIYHEPNNSIIKESGGGSLLIQGDNIRLQKVDGTENMLTAVNDGQLKLFYDGAEKLATTATGIDVTGEITADALTINSSGVQIGTILQSTSTISARLSLMDANTTAASQVGIGATGNTLGLYADGGSPKVVVSGTGINVTGGVTADGLTVDNITIDGNEIDVSSGDLTLDVAGDIILDADGADVILKDGGTGFLEIDKDGNNARLKNPIADGDIKIQGIDGASTITMVSFDASSAGAATFNSTVTSTGLTANVPSGNGLLINSADISTIKMKNTGGSVKNWGFATTNLAAGDFGIYASNSNGGDPITAGAAKLYFTSTGAATFTGAITANAGLDVSGSVTVSKGGSTAAHGDTDLLVRHNSATSTTAQAQILAGNAGYSNLYFSDTDSYNVGGFIYNHASNYLATNVNGSERLRIDSAGNVGIGTVPQSKLDIDVAVDTSLGLRSQTGVIVAQYTGAPAVGNRAQIGLGYGNAYTNVSIGAVRTSAAAYGTDDFIIATKSGTADTAPTERMRIDSAGNLLVGTTSNSSSVAGVTAGNSGLITACRSSNYSGIFNRLSTDGDIVLFRKDGTTVGSIGSYIAYMYIGSTGGTDTHIGFVNGTVRPATATGGLLDNTLDLGSSGARWDDIYATNGTIQTSDRNEKQDIAELSEAEQRVAVAAKGLLRKFRWKDSVAEKGDDARIHFGIIAQDLQAAFEAEGLDAGDYAMFISTAWTDEETNEEKTRMGVRYSELLAFIISAI